MDRFKDWQEGDYIAFIVDKALAGLATVTGLPFKSEEVIWEEDLYQYRIPIKFLHVLSREDRVPILGEVRDVLTSALGPRYGWGLRNQQLLEGPKAETIIEVIRSRPNSISQIESKIDQFIDEAKQQEKTISATKQKRRHTKNEILTTETEFKSPENESAHSMAQAALIKLGIATGCRVWIASNDRGRLFQGKPLGEGCLPELPSMGLNDEAIRRISLIDILWLRQNAPICAFEIETTTSIYSGLLRMADLLAVVPALNIKLFIVAPSTRQDRVMAEINRPTFRKIGLNEYCKFIPLEELQSLLKKIQGMEGHIQHTIIDAIAVEVDEDE